MEAPNDVHNSIGKNLLPQCDCELIVKINRKMDEIRGPKHRYTYGHNKGYYNTLDRNEKKVMLLHLMLDILSSATLDDVHKTWVACISRMLNKYLEYLIDNVDKIPFYPTRD
jgi:hypothetical protein